MDELSANKVFIVAAVEVMVRVLFDCFEVLLVQSVKVVRSSEQGS